MLDLGKTHLSIAIKYFVKKFMPKEWSYKSLMNKAHEVEQESLNIWIEEFGFLNPSINKEDKEQEERDEKVNTVRKEEITKEA